ncbi:MAG: sigma-70 family RNA polymerase sigma factor [Thermoanaerobaculia bacterium]
MNVKLIENDYHVLRSFSGRSGMATYLTSVIQNLARDYRMSRWGRWRPTAAAERLGLVAVQLETFIDRDGFTLDEAVEMLRSNHGVRLSRLELVDLAAKLPPRVRLRIEDDEALDTTPASYRADQGLTGTERREILEQARQALASSFSELDLEDRLVLKMHYQSGLTIAAIAAALDLDQRRLYTRRERCWRQLKAALERRGLGAAEVLDAVGWAEADFAVDFGLERPEVAGTEPSNSAEAGREEQR